MKTYRIAAIPGDGIGTEVIDAGVEVLKALAAREGKLRVPVRSLRLGRRVLQEARPHDAGERPRPDPPSRRHPVRLGRPPRYPRSHHAVGTAARICQPFDQYANVRPTRILPGITSPLRAVNGQGTRLGHRAREFGGRICRGRRPRSPGLAAGGRHRRLDVHPRRRRADHALCFQARALPSAQAADRRHQVERSAPRHGDVGRDRSRGRRANSPT